MNLYDIMRTAGGGNAFTALAPQFGLSAEQVARAVEAFLPAFSAGLKKSTADPLGLMELFRRLAEASYAQAYLRPEQFFGAPRREGEDALRFLFGSPEAADAVARQASAFTGLAQAKLAEIMPVIAAIMFGGLAAQARAANPVLDAMMKEFQAGGSKRPDAPKGPLDRYEEEQEKRGRDAAADLAHAQADLLKSGLAAFQAGTAAWQKAMGEMARTAGGGALAGDASQPGTEPSGRDVFGEMFESGVRASEAYQREMEALLERMRPETSRR
jgi:hypothetical protein